MHESGEDRRQMSRRRFLAAGSLAGGALALACADQMTDPRRLARRALASALGNRAPESSGIEHVIVVMMENRSFDHMLGWVPRADGKQAGLKFTDNDGASHHTRSLAPDFQGCGHPDPDHSYEGGRIQYNGGKCDGFLRSGDNDVYAIGYYRRQDLSFLGRAVPDWATSDRYFCSILGPTFPNRFYQHAAQTDRISNTLVLSTLPTIWDRLAASGRSGRYYYSDLPFIALWGAKYLPIARPISAFYADCAAGTLPNVCFVEPAFAGEDEGTSSDDHPHADIRSGERFMHQIYTAVTQSPAWESTVLVFNYDEWGGFYDHVAPPARPIPATDLAAGNTDGLLGFRTPLLVVSPFARRAHVAHGVYDHTSILKMIEWRWGLDPLSVRDASANNLADLLALFSERDAEGNEREDRAAPQYPEPFVPLVTACPAPPTAGALSLSPGSLSRQSLVASRASSRSHWLELREVAVRHGWDVRAS